MTGPDPLRARGSLIEALSSALDRGAHGLQNVPGLLKRVLEDGSWQEFMTARGERVLHEQFGSFVTEPPLRGLGAEMPMIVRIIGTGDPDLIRLLRDATRTGRGNGKRSDSERLSTDSSAYQAARLAREAPAEYAAVQRGEKTLNAATIAAGIRKHRVSVRLDDAESAAATLRKHMTPAQLTKLRDLLGE